MRIAELSRASGVPVATIKYYVREGLLPPGELTSPNQARYDDSHLRRLKLVRALVDVGGLSIAATRDVLACVDSRERSLHQTLGKVQYALTARREGARDDAAWEEAAREVDDLISRRGWIVSARNPARQTLTELLVTLRDLRHDLLPGRLDEYADAAEMIAATDLESVLSQSDIEGTLEGVVVGVVLGDAILSALRRLAQEDASARATADAPRASAAGPRPPAQARAKSS